MAVIGKVSVAKIQPIVLCGGSGTRLWPLSRKSLPKQFTPLFHGKSLIQLTLERLTELAEGRPVLTVAREDYRFLVRDAAEAANVACKIILEPDARDTAPAMAVAALNAKPDELLLFLPSDHHIPDTEQFVHTVRSGISAAEQGSFVTFGVVPTRPHTGYGYMQVDKSSQTMKRVVKFVEKPDEQTALAYLTSGDYCWNAGIFLVRADSLIKSLAQHAPDILDAAKNAVAGQLVDGGQVILDKQAFSQCRRESIDYALLEHHADVFMVPFQGTWSDVGSWNAVAELAEADVDNNQVSGHGLTYLAKSTYIHAPHRLVVALGTDDLIVVDTQDAVLVAAKRHVEQVKGIVADLQKRDLVQAVEHRHARRPWGEYDSVDEGERFKVKRITVKPGASLSLQLHHHRAEHWIVVKGTAQVTCNSKTFLLAENQSTYIPVGTKHRLENPGTIPLEIIEVQSGSYLGEDDILRFEDSYGRTAK